MIQFKLSCQTYTWEMLGDELAVTFDSILAGIAESGYHGFEPTTSLLDRMGLYQDPQDLMKLMGKYDLQLSALFYPGKFGFTNPDHAEADIRGASEAIGYVSQFPSLRLLVGSGHCDQKEYLARAFTTMVQVYRTICDLAIKKEVKVNCHLDSLPVSILKTESSYDKLMAEVPDIGLCPDTGHIKLGGNDPLKVMQRHIKRIHYVHFKDIDKNMVWCPMGRGIVNFQAIVDLLNKSSYEGWVVLEEECPQSRANPVKIVRENLSYIQELLHTGKNGKGNSKTEDSL